MFPLFLRRTACFAAIILAVLAIGEVIARNIPGPYEYKHKWLCRYGGDVTTLILGSSHAYYGIRPDILSDSAFNLANVSQSPEYDFMLLKHYADSMPELRRVIVTVSYFTYRDPRLEDSKEWMRVIPYRIQMDLPAHSPLSLYNFEISDFGGYCAKLKGLVAHSESNRCDSLGFGLGFDTDHRNENWRQEAATRVAETTYPASERSNEVADEIGRLLDYCRQRNIECILVTTPVWPSYHRILDRGQLDEMRRLTDSLSARYGATYLDFMADKSFTADDFHDVDHLSPSGAVKLTQAIKARSVKVGASARDVTTPCLRQSVGEINRPLRGRGLRAGTLHHTR